VPKHDHEEAQRTLVCGALVALLGSFGEVQRAGLVGWCIIWCISFSWRVHRDSRGSVGHAFFS